MKGLKKKVGVMSSLAALALVGSAFAVWHFGENVNKSIDADYYIEAAADAGTIDSVDLTWGKAASLNDGAGPHAVAADGKILILDQPNNGEDRKDVHWAYETADNATQVACKAQYTYGFEDETKRLAVILTYSVDFVDGSGNVETDSGLAKYISITNNSGTWTPNAYITMPTLAYKTGMAPDTIEKYNTMLTDLQGSKIRFKFKATATAHQTPITIDGMTFTLNADGESYSLTGYSAPATPSGLYKPLKKLASSETLTIPGTVDGAPVTEIGQYALSDLGSIHYVIIPNTVTTICTEAFSESGIYEIDIPNSVTYIGQSAFWYCENLTRVKMSSSISYIGNIAFEKCQALKSFEFNGNSNFQVNSEKTLILNADGTSIVSAAAGASSIAVPNTVTEIPTRNLDGCLSLVSLTIPASVQSIGSIRNCEKLASITYLGTKAQWKQISFGDKCFFTVDSPKTAYAECTDGETSTMPDTLGLAYELNEEGTGYLVSGIGSVVVANLPYGCLAIPEAYNGRSEEHTSELQSP